MSWLAPDDIAHERISLTSPEVLELAEYLSLSPRIEPLLLRNIRLKFLPGSDPDLEHRLWFSNIIVARSTRNIVMDQGVARLLADHLKEKGPYDEVWLFIQECTAHWSTLDKLELQIRFDLLQKNGEAVNQSVQCILRKIASTQDDDIRLNLARWAKRTLSVIANEKNVSDEIAWLVQYAATALGATSAWTTLGSKEPLPVWLANALPRHDSVFSKSKIALQLRYDENSNVQVLECLSPDQSGNVLDLPTPLPARLNIQCDYESDGRWVVVDIGSRIKIPVVSKVIELRTIDGKAYQLSADFEPARNEDSKNNTKKIKLFLTYVGEDKELAHQIESTLKRQQIDVTLIEEQPGITRQEAFPESQLGMLRLWTPAAQALWDKVEMEPILVQGKSLLLRTNQAELPLGTQAAQVIDLDETHNLAPAIQQWLEEDEKPPSAVTEQDEIDALLKELENPETRPRRRLEIGDRLAELGDPRKGVGVMEYEIIEYPPEIQSLLDEIADINTEPPRRLEIGNRLAEMGDPRPGVGLDQNGLPDIGWVEIPAGSFIYGEGENRQTIELPRFYISRYPITNAQYQAFIDAGGYQKESWWRGLLKPEPEEPRWRQVNRPRENIDWNETVAFTRWLSKQLGYDVSLPAEQQWEKAARGTDGRLYPWGEEYKAGYANINEIDRKGGRFYLKETTAVGLYPQGASPYGVEDMAGNVWEWCLNKFDKLQVNLDESDDVWVLCGGSWFNDPMNVRCVIRNWYYPGTRNFNFGFRVVCSSPYNDR